MRCGGGMRIIRANEEHFHGRGREALRASAKRGEIRRIYRGVYFDAEGAGSIPPHAEHVARIAAIAPTLSTGVLSGVSAAALHGLPLLHRRLGGLVEVTRSSGPGRTRWVRSHRAVLDDADVVEVHGLRVTSIARTLRDLHRDLGFGELLAAADGAARMGFDLDGLARIGRFAARIEFLRHHASDRSESYGESLSRATMIELGMPLPELQVDVLDEDGRRLGRSDFLWREFRSLGEFDGRVKYDGSLEPDRTPADVLMAERHREQRMRAVGWGFARWGWAIANSAEQFRSGVLTTLELGRRLPPARGRVELPPASRTAPPDWQELLGTAR